MKRFKTKTAQGRDYAKMLKEYFGFHLYGMDLRNEGGQIQALIVYEDFKHIDTVRKELAQMMPEVEFVKIAREFTNTAMLWALGNIISYDAPAPVLYVQRGDTLVKTTVRDIATAELRQLEIEDSDNLPYTDKEKELHSDDDLRYNAED